MTEATVAAPVVVKNDRLTTKEFIDAYKSAHAEGLTMDGFSAKINLKKGSATVRLSTIRKDLVEKNGLTEAQVDAYLPSLSRASRSVKTERDTTLTDIAAEIKAAVAV